MDGRNIFMGYLNMEDKTLETFSDDWLVKSGDIGRVDEDGFLFIVGRFKGKFKSRFCSNPKPPESSIFVGCTL